MNICQRSLRLPGIIILALFYAGFSFGAEFFHHHADELKVDRSDCFICHVAVTHVAIESNSSSFAVELTLINTVEAHDAGTINILCHRSHGDRAPPQV